MQTANRFAEMKRQKREELQSNRYSQFREQFEDIFESTYDKKVQQEQ